MTTTDVPQFVIPVESCGTVTQVRGADGVVHAVSGALERSTDWRSQPGDAGLALVELFGRMSELIITRLNQTPGKHFLAFLNEAGIDLLPPRPANTELTFTLAKDITTPVKVPAGTQVATKQTETQPEVVFETQRDLVVSPNALVKVVAFDPMTSSDRTAQAPGQAGDAPFAAFQGEGERERILYLGDPDLFTFSDAASRSAAAVTLTFEFASPGVPSADGGWKLEWHGWNGTEWAVLAVGAAGVVTDGTEGFSKDGAILFKHLPELAETDVNGVTGRWLACKLTGGSAREHLPVIKRIRGSREIKDLAGLSAADAAFSAAQAGAAFAPLNTADGFLPLGQRPTRLDAFYLASQEAFSKEGATVKIDLAGLIGVPAAATSTDLSALTVVWEYYSTDGWTELGTSRRAAVTARRLSFTDTSKAFTAAGTESVPATISFVVPDAKSDSPLFAKAKVNDQEGYWLRARLVAGSYNVPAWVEVIDKTTGSYTFHEAQTYPPDIKRLKIGYSGYGSSLSGKEITLHFSQVDGAWRQQGGEWGDTSPFCAAEEGPALYLGFKAGFPADKWIQVLLDVDEAEEVPEARPIVFWEYWNGATWLPLRTSDGTQGLGQRGYLGFFGPADHQPGTEFGQNAYWLRARPHLAPIADAGPDQTLVAANAETPATLDASASRGLDGQTITSYTWRLANSSAAVADAGPDQIVTTGEAEAAVTLDGSRSFDITRAAIGKFIWQRAARAEASPPGAAAGPETGQFQPCLRAIRINTVPALNAVTLRDEALGFGNGKPGQVFKLLRVPVLPGAGSGACIAVCEPDRPPDDELMALQAELRDAGEAAEALLPASGTAPGPAPIPAPGQAAGQGVWVRWRQVADFFASTGASRHFTLDPITGEVRFGDGVRGKIPPVGRDNIKAVRYRSSGAAGSGGAAGNVAAGAVTVLRNPSGDLANIKSVTNPEAAAGGSDAETVAEVQSRGPQTLKHRQRAVTVEDYVWLAREASGEVAQAWCLPTCNPKGLPEPGWVTVVIAPEGTDARPAPSPALRRAVQSYLERAALANLDAVNQILVKGPEYVEATALARVVPVEPEKSDEVELAILSRLESFLHPLRGGPGRAGWDLGRDVYLSEICAEIEAVAGVDHVAGVRLLSSLRQARLTLRAGKPPVAPFDLAVGSQVSTFDDRIKMLLAERVSGGQAVASLAIYDFKIGDEVTIVACDNKVLVEALEISALDGDAITLAQPFEPPPNWDQRAAVMSADGRLRLLLDAVTLDPAGEKVTGLVRARLPARRQDQRGGRRPAPSRPGVPADQRHRGVRGSHLRAAGPPGLFRQPRYRDGPGVTPCLSLCRTWTIAPTPICSQRCGR